MDEGRPLLGLRNLSITAPDGRPLVAGLDLTLAPGEIAVLLGASGAGKSTLARFLLEPDALAADGFVARADEAVVATDELGLVPQKGALFDHLDVGGNIGLALRYGNHADDGDVRRWLTAVGLDAALASAPVSSLSGGQAQRLAVARVLASGRRLLILDEPSVGLDPERVRSLARLILTTCRENQVAALVITHDPALAAGVADKLLVLHDAKAGPLVADWPGPQEDPAHAATRGAWLLRLETTLVDLLQPSPAPSPSVPRRSPPSPTFFSRVSPLRALAHAVDALRFSPAQLTTHPADYARIATRVVTQAFLRPLAFYAIVSTLIGYTVLYVLSRIGGAGVRPDYLLRQIGGAAVTTLAPPLSAILFVAASGGAVSAWLGGMGLTRQLAALNALGVPIRRYLVAPTWLALGLSALGTAVVFAGGMLVGGWLLCRQLHVDHAWDLLTADLLDPRPSRVRHVARAGVLVWTYAWGAASGVVAEGLAPMRTSDDVTRAMTRGVVLGTLWVVVWELASALVVFR